jgi:hypothetical protein
MKERGLQFLNGNGGALSTFLTAENNDLISSLFSKP